MSGNQDPKGMQPGGVSIDLTMPRGYAHTLVIAPGQVMCITLDSGCALPGPAAVLFVNFKLNDSLPCKK